MRLSLSAYIALWIGLVYVAAAILIHARGCTYRLRRARRLYEAGRIAEGDRVVAAVETSHAAFRRRHPTWRLARAGVSA